MEQAKLRSSVVEEAKNPVVARHVVIISAAALGVVLATCQEAPATNYPNAANTGNNGPYYDYELGLACRGEDDRERTNLEHIYPLGIIEISNAQVRMVQPRVDDCRAASFGSDTEEFNA